MKNLIKLGAASFALSLIASGAGVAQAATTHGLGVMRQAIVDLPVQASQYADFIPGFVWVDGHWVPVCCIPDPAELNPVDVRNIARDTIVQFVDAASQTIQQYDNNIGSVRTFAQLAGIDGIAIDGHTGNTYAIAPGVLYGLSSAGRVFATQNSPVRLDSLTVLCPTRGGPSCPGYKVGAYDIASGMLTLFDGQTLQIRGAMQMPAGLFGQGVPVRIASSGNNVLLHPDGAPFVVSVDPTSSPWRISELQLAGAQNPMGLGADANGNIYVSINGALAAFNRSGRPVRTSISGLPATPHFALGH